MGLLASTYDKSKYLRAEDVKKEVRLRIVKVTEETFDRDGRSEKKLVIWFAHEPQGLVLNKTNNRALRNAYGDDSDNWVEQTITIAATMADFRGKVMPALRVRIPRPADQAKAAGGDDMGGDEVPF